MKKIIAYILFLTVMQVIHAQSTYCDFGGGIVMNFHSNSSEIDSSFIKLTHPKKESSEIKNSAFLFHVNSFAPETEDFSSPSNNSINTTMADGLRSFKLSNNPNPVRENAYINFQLNSSGAVSLKLYDMLGNSISSVLDQYMSAGSYSIPVKMENIPNGIYFYVLKKEGLSQAMKMLVSK